MEENIQKYRPLGNKTLFMLIFKKSPIMVLLVPILFFGLFFLNYVPLNYINIAAVIIIAYLMLLLIILGIIFFIGWLQYFRYAIFLGDKDLKIVRGLIATEQIGIPYRYIKDIKIERSLIDQIFGVSDIIITVLGSDENKMNDESTTILPSLSKEIALQIQDIVLKKAQVEQISILGGQKIN